jgi:hypothetical protein
VRGMLYIEKIYAAVKAKHSQEEIDQSIAEAITESSDDTTVEQWKLDNYQLIREWAYPTYIEYIDAQVKINSKDLVLVSEGTEQLNRYYEDCLKVKDTYKKSGEVK